MVCSVMSRSSTESLYSGISWVKDFRVVIFRQIFM